MQSKYVYSKRAESQIKKIYLDTAQKWGVSQADKYDIGLLQTIEILADNPEMGRQCDNIRKGYRRHEYERHIIFYRRRSNDILITNVIYDGMDFKRIFKSKGMA